MKNLHTFNLPYFHSFILAYIHTCILAYLYTYQFAYLHNCILAYLCTCIFINLYIYKFAFLYTYILAYLHTCIVVNLHTWDRDFLVVSTTRLRPRLFFQSLNFETEAFFLNLSIHYPYQPWTFNKKWLVYDLQLVLDLSWQLLDLFMTCLQLVHDLFMTCLTTCSWLV